MNKVIYFCIYLVVILILSDVFIQLSGIQDTSNYMVDSEYGIIKRRNHNYIKFNEGFSIGRINEGSNLSNYYPINRPTDHLRIALIGDSYVEGMQVFERDHFRTITEEVYRKKYHKKIEVLNFGNSGIALDGMYCTDANFVRKYNPNIIFYFVNTADFTEEKCIGLVAKPELKSNNSIIIDNHFSKDKINRFEKVYSILQKSSLSCMLNNFRKIINTHNMSKILFDKFARIKYNNPLDKVSKISISPKYKAILKELSRGNKVIFVNRADSKFPVEISQVLLEHKIQFIDLYPVLDKLYNDGLDPHHWKATNKQGHWNQIAHKAIGTYLAVQINDFITNSKTSVFVGDEYK